MRRLLPHHVLTAGLLLVWLLLTAFTPGQFLLGLVVAAFAGWSMSRLEPTPLIIRSWSAAVRLFGVVFVDILQSNWQVARTILFDRAERRSGFVAVPLDIRNRNALTTLALIINNAPGTSWLEYDSASGVLLIHVLEYTSDAEWIGIVKTRYEPLLKEIFE